MIQNVEVINVTKKFKPHSPFLSRNKRDRIIVAVDKVSLTISPGEIFTLIGPNAAGKSTLIRMVCGLIVPTSGQVKIAGQDLFVCQGYNQSLIGLVNSQERSFYWRLTLRENLEFFGSLYGFSRKGLRSRIVELSELLGFARFLDRRFQECSSGVKQKLMLARSLIHRPRILVMDEPFINVDQETSFTSMDFIKQELIPQGCTVMIATHNLGFSKPWTDRFGIMVGGQLQLGDWGSSQIEDVYSEIIKNRKSQNENN
jgi:ABC-2 type transport system ATP-binding protein